MTEKPPAAFVEVDTSPERLARIWGRVSAELEDTNPTRGRVRKAGWAWAAAGLIGAAAATTLVMGNFFERAPATSVLSGAALETASDTLHVDLDDGSQLTLSAHSRAVVEKSNETAVELQLLRGELACQVTPNRARSFDVVALGVRVRVTGTKFSVEVSDDARVTVAVSRGTVEVTPPGATLARRLSAGEQWTLDTRVAAAGRNYDESTSDSEAEPSPSALVPEPTPTRVPVAKPPQAQAQAPGENGDRDRDPREATLDARGLLDQGNAARRAGDVAGAAQAYEQLLARYPGDARAGLAAFELGRLRMDRLGNLAGAVQALRTAVKLAPGSAFREDAIARLVQAYAAMGATAQCRTFREQYLDAYPKGVHAGTVTSKCPP